MSNRPWYKRYPSDFLHGTTGMTLEEKGAYSVVLDLIYDRGGPIPDDARWIAGHCGCSVRLWNRIRDALVVAGKLVSDGVHLSNPRADREVEAAAETAKKLAENGAKGGNKSAETRRNFAIIQGGVNENKDLAEAPGEAGLKHTRAFQKLDTRYPPKSPDGGLPSQEDFQGFKEAFPRRDGAHDWTEARKRFAKLVKAGTDPQALINAARAYKAETERTGAAGTRFVKQASTFLNSVWRDYAACEASSKPDRPPGWPSNLPALENVRGAWERGIWPGNWGAEPGDPACRVPPAFLEQWRADRQANGGAA